MNIDGSTVLVAGGSSGLGRATALELRKLGAQVMVADLKPFEGDDAGIAFCETDVTDEASVSATLNKARDRFGPIRGTVVCAGIIHASRVVGREGPFDLTAFRRVIDVNLVGTFNVLRLAAAAMTDNEQDASGERGVIVTTSSVAAFEGQIGQAAYSASKGGVAALTIPAARELGKFGIRVISVAPGIFETPMMQLVSDNYRTSLESQTAFPKRFGKPEEYAALVTHIFENSMLNGEVIRLDGGLRMPPK